MSFRGYPEYRDSGVEWLGEIPTHWEVAPLKRLCSVMPSNVDKKSYDGDAPVLLCNYTDVYYNDRITDQHSFMAATATTAQIDRFTLRADDVIVTKDSESADDIAVATYVPEDLPGVVCGYHLAILRPVDGCSGAFIKRVCDSAYAKSAFGVRANGLTRVGLATGPLGGVLVTYPPLEEQTNIAAFLDDQLNRLDALIAEQQRLIELLREKRQAVIFHAVTKGLDPSVPMRPSGVDWLGTIPAHWVIRPLKAVSTQYCDGPFGSGLKSSHYSDAGARVVRLQNIRAMEFDGSDEAYIDLDYYAELEKHSIVPGDLLIAGLGDEHNTVGRACVSPIGIEPAIVKADCFRFRLDPDLAIGDFVAAQLSAGAPAEAGVLATGSTRSRISLIPTSRRMLALPPLAEQASVAQEIRRVIRYYAALTDAASRSIALLRERRTALISAAVTGKIDVRSFANSEAA